MSIRRDVLFDAKVKAKRFMQIADRLQRSPATSCWEGERFEDGADAAECKRASMDLTRALAQVRKGIFGETR